MIGIIGGVGPFAGLDLNKKIFENTSAKTDQEHLGVILFSLSQEIADRTEYLKDPPKIKNPAIAMAKIADTLQKAGATVLGIPCNTAHSPLIFDVFEKMVHEKNPQMKIIHMIRETFKQLSQLNLSEKKVGLLATLGTFKSHLYQDIATQHHYEILEPDDQGKQEVHQAIYSKEYGIKSAPTVTKKAQQVMIDQSNELIKKGAKAIILGCTEIPLALDSVKLSVPKIDPTTILARALIHSIAPEKLLKI